jgi:hypothetical protein
MARVSIDLIVGPKDLTADEVKRVHEELFRRISDILPANTHIEVRGSRPIVVVQLWVREGY